MTNRWIPWVVFVLVTQTPAVVLGQPPMNPDQGLTIFVSLTLIALAGLAIIGIIILVIALVVKRWRL